jgi:hypothetical protein
MTAKLISTRALLLLTFLSGVGCVRWGLGEWQRVDARQRARLCARQAGDAARVRSAALRLGDEAAAVLAGEADDGELFAARAALHAAQLVYSADRMAATADDAAARALIARAVHGEPKEDVPLGSAADREHVLDGAGYGALRDARRKALRDLLPKIIRGLGRGLAGLADAVLPRLPWWMRWGFWLAVAAFVLPLLVPPLLWLARRYRRGLRAAIGALDEAKRAGKVEAGDIERRTAAAPVVKREFHRMRREGVLPRADDGPDADG